ncbi:HYCCIN [Salix koriyanagi]|uniref:HYCCIN n=1 Tax=Salix koriyanagi TaxID=2511006 RepID=A0A9Q0Z125_9ROSI|nr:HYCCIN [Salix koriyanagi]
MSEDGSSSEETNTPTTSVSQDTSTAETTAITTSAFNIHPETPSSSSSFNTHLAIQSLSSILTTVSPSLLSQDQDPAFYLLHNPDISSQVSSLLRLPDSGAGDNNLCRWFYDTFQSSEPQLQLVVLRFLPIIAGLYLSRVALKKPLAGFEAVLLAIYAHETTSRAGQAVTVNVPDLSYPSIYHESKRPPKDNDAADLNLAVISPSLEPHGTVRSTRRARIVGVALELYYSKIYLMPVGSKIDFCEFCKVWSGQEGHELQDDEDNVEFQDNQGNADKESVITEGRIALPWELLQPVSRILGHCLLGPTRDEELIGSASAACRSLYSRSLHDINPHAILATRSLLRLSKMALDPKNNVDHTEIPMSDVISL